MVVWDNKQRRAALTGLALTAALAASPALGATRAATATATTIRPLSLVKTSDLEFGTIVPSATAGTVTVDATTNARTKTGGVVLATGATPGAAGFTAAGLVNILALITLPTNITLTRGGGTETMLVDNITTNGGTTRLFPGSATIDVTVGGRLNVGANQVAGSYSGTFNVTVIYL